MVLVPIAKELLKVGIKYASRYYRIEGKAFEKLYTGFRPGVARGIRHGLVAGSVVGETLKNNFSDDTTSGFQKKRSRYSPRKPYKTRDRYSGRYNSRSKRGKQSYFSRRCPRPRKCY